VNDVRAHPCAPHLLLSASKDESCRLWNIDNGLCLAIFSGALGHRNEVLTVDFKMLDPKAEDLVFVSGAMDNMVKVWSMEGYRHLIKLSEDWKENSDNFPTAHIQTPVFSTFGRACQISPAT
jgi:polycomb protein EED